MAIVKMKRLRLMGMRSDQEELLHVLQKLGCVEISQPADEPEDQTWGQLSKPDGAALNVAKENGAAAAAALDVLKKYANAKRGMMDPRPVISAAELFDDGAYAAALETAKVLNHAERQINALYSEENKIKTQKLSIAPWMSLDVPLDAASTREMLVQFGTIPSQMDMNKVTAALSDATDLAMLTVASSDADAHYLLYVCHKSALETANAVLKEFSFSPAALKGWTGTAAENDARLDKELEEVAARIEEEKAGIQAMADQRPALERCADRAKQEIQREEAKACLLDTETAFFLDGWVPVSDEERLTKALSDYLCAWELTEPGEEDYPQVPVKLKNNWFTKPLNMVTEMYVYPAYDGLDPNPLMAPFFILYFGIMMADMAYGLLMLLGGWFLKFKMKAKGTMDHMGGLLLLCGASTFIVGAMTGGFFGDMIPQLLKIINPESTFEMPYLFSPLNDTLAILIGSLVMGVIQIITGMIISIVYKCKNGDFIDALFSEIAWFVIFAGAGLAVLGIGSVAGVPLVLVAGALMLLVGGTRNAKGFGKVTSAVGIIYNGVTGYFSDILSYARIMALMLSGSVIASVFNTLGAVVGNVIGFVVVSLLGNAINLALNLLGCYVHDLRLQCLEFFGRFYKEGGRPFKPLAVNTKYVDIIKEEN